MPSNSISRWKKGCILSGRPDFLICDNSDSTIGTYQNKTRCTVEVESKDDEELYQLLMMGDLFIFMNKLQAGESDWVSHIYRRIMVSFEHTGLLDFLPILCTRRMILFTSATLSKFLFKMSTCNNNLCYDLCWGIVGKY